ncbi:MAG: response regulator [Deltaproteobacteria bacterium]|nr:response regulator [Deltaproteobacteria bacterium]
MKPGIKLRILLVEDNDSVRSVLSKILAERGYEVFTFSNPAICPLQIQPECRCGPNETCVDIIVSDLDMPNMTGLGFIEKQKKKNCKCQHVVLMSGFWTEQDLSRARGLGCKTFTKPLPFEEFYAWLDEVEKKIEPARQLCNWFQDSDSLPED